MTKIIEATNIATGITTKWVVPSTAAALAHSKATHGRQYDPIERKHVEGGEPMVWVRA